jgi:hypothetical protein
MSNYLRASADAGDLGEFGSCLFGTAGTIGAPRSLPDLSRHGEPFMIELASPAESGLGVRVDAGQQFATLAPGVAFQNLQPVVGREQGTECLLYDPLAVRTHRAPRARRDTVWHGFPGMSFLAYPFKFRLPAKVDSRQTVTASGFRELLQFFDPYRTFYRLPVKERCERFTYQTPKTLIGERFQTGTVEFDCYRSPTGAAFFRRGWNGSHRAVVRYEDRAAAAGRVISLPLDIRRKTDRSVARCRCSHESLDRVE